MGSNYRAGFTLLEICLALLIGVMIIVLAVPSIAGLLAEQRLKDSFARFDRLAAIARLESATRQRECRLVWGRNGITLNRSRPVGAGENESPNGEETMVFLRGESFQLQRTAALQKNPPAEWVFWRNGTCEPVQVAFAGPDGKWRVSYDPLTGHATFLNSEVP